MKINLRDYCDMGIKLVFLSDLHFDRQENAGCPERCGQYADVLLLRVVHRINRYIKPDAVIIGGDVINVPDADDASELLGELKRITDLLQCPSIIIPGNHDPEPAKFYQVFDNPGDYVDIEGCRIIPFFDRETPGFNAVRSEADLKSLQGARDDFAGPLITLQHVPVSEPGTTQCPYNLDNAPDVLQAMAEGGVKLSLAGHYHAGFEGTSGQGTELFTASALCEFPFSYYVIELDDSGHVETRRENLAWTGKTPLYDLHVHTQFAYCNENMTLQKALELSKALNLAGIGFNEHTAHLYFSRQDYGRGVPYTQGISAAKPEDCRVEAYMEQIAMVNSPVCYCGFELDFDDTGLPIVQSSLLDNAELQCGALHRSLLGKTQSEAEERFLWLSRQIIESGVDFLAHPFRAFRRSGFAAPVELYEPLADLLKQNGVAAEVNFHTNDPDPEFFRLCLERGVKIVFGSDSHNLYEVGEFYGFMNLMRQLGTENMLEEIMFSPQIDV
jgi:histidinol phosphatase-like PHP family hydrolase/calcineurin-like phosphoesterase family protein